MKTSTQISKLELFENSKKIEQTLHELSHLNREMDFETLLNEMQEQAATSEDFENLGPDIIKNSIAMFNLLRKTIKEISNIFNIIENTEQKISLIFIDELENNSNNLPENEFSKL